jgi:prevent-host-death family protein
MVKRMGITETRKELNNLATSMGVDDTISVTNRGKEVLAIMPWEAYETITETLEIL